MNIKVLIPILKNVKDASKYFEYKLPDVDFDDI